MQWRWSGCCCGPGSIYVVGRGLHRALWHDRQTEAGVWGKLLLTALVTALWFGLLAQVAGVRLPGLFPAALTAASDPAQ